MTADQFELFCKDGTRRPLSEYRSCNWGIVPSHALVTSSARTAEERKRYQQFMEKLVHMYSHQPVVNASTVTNQNRYEGFNQFDRSGDDKYYDRSSLNTINQSPTDRFNQRFDNNANRGGFGRLDTGFAPERNDTRFDNDTQLYEKFDLFESKRYGGRLNLMFQDSARNLVPIKEEDQSFAGYLGQSLGLILGIRQCPVGRMTLCVTSEAELEKCVKMRVSILEAESEFEYQRC